MLWFDMPEGTEKERAEKEIAECAHCINGVVNTMKQLGVPQKEWGSSLVIKAYMERIDRAKVILGIK